MKTLTLILAISLAVFIMGCSASGPVKSSLYGGSKSDGMVTMSYGYRGLDRPRVNRESELITAKSACSKWGYSDAIRFGVSVKECLGLGYLNRCNRARVDTKYQCID